MNEIFRDLHSQLLNGIDECEKTNTDFRKHIECCFHICERVSLAVDQKAATMVFTSEEEEINFFKSVRPQFTSLVEFYSIIYRAELFGPETGIDKIAFLADELERANQFLADNELFYNYIKSGSTTKDKTFFSRSSPNNANYQHLMAQLLAREIYIEFIKKKLPAEES